MICIGNKRECFFDNYLIDEEKTTAEARLHRPVAREVVLNCDKPWETRGIAYENFFYDEEIGKYRLYYLGREALTESLRGEQIRVCYAESEDGLSWTKPDLGICAFKGSCATNIILDEKTAPFYDNFMVFKDENPACPPEKRYKGIGDHQHTLTCFFSADGLHFKVGNLITDRGSFDSLNTAFYDKEIGKYRVYFRGLHEPGDDEGKSPFDQTPLALPWQKKEDLIRDIRYMESDDFVNFTEQKRIRMTGDDVQVYTNCISPYPFAPHLLVGFPTRYLYRQQWSAAYDSLCTNKDRVRVAREHPRYGLALTDCVFMTSRDGVNFKRYNEAFMRPDAEYDGNWCYGECYPARGFILTEPEKSGEGVDKELSMLCHDRERYGGNLRLRRYTIRRDGFVSRHAGGEEKLLVTKPFVFEGERLTANLSTSAFGYAIFKLETADGTLCTESVEYFGDATDKPIAFRDPVVLFSGKEVVLTVRLLDADLYAIKFE